MVYWIDLTLKNGQTRSLHGVGSVSDIIEVVRFIKKNWDVKKVKIRKETR